MVPVLWRSFLAYDDQLPPNYTIAKRYKRYVRAESNTRYQTYIEVFVISEELLR